MIPVHTSNRPLRRNPCNLHQVTRVPVLLCPNETLLDTPRGHKPVEDADTPSLVVGTATPGTSERLLTNDSSRAFFIVIHVSGSVAEPIGGLDEHLSVRREAGEILISRLCYDEDAYIDPVSAY